MKIKVSRTYEKRPAKIETVIEEIEVWECPDCHGTLFTQGYAWQIEKKTESIYNDFHYNKHTCMMIFAIICAQCHKVVWKSI
jgi:hypothetical protein